LVVVLSTYWCRHNINFRCVDRLQKKPDGVLKRLCAAMRANVLLSLKVTWKSGLSDFLSTAMPHLARSTYLGNRHNATTIIALSISQQVAQQAVQQAVQQAAEQAAE
jgi:hypothetical protein